MGGRLNYNAHVIDWLNCLWEEICADGCTAMTNGDDQVADHLANQLEEIDYKLRQEMEICNPLFNQ